MLNRVKAWYATQNVSRVGAFLVLVTFLVGIGVIWSVYAIRSRADGSEPVVSAPATKAASLAVVNPENTGETTQEDISGESQKVAQAPATATPVATVVPTVVPTVTPAGVAMAASSSSSAETFSQEAAVAEVPVVQTTGAWTFTWFPAADFDRGDGTTFRQDVQNLWPSWNDWPVAPAKWPTPPNVPNPLESRFRVKQVNGVDTVPDGVEIPQGEANYCQVLQGEKCTNPVEPRHYMLYTGDGGNCTNGMWDAVEGKGNVLIVVNVGNVTARFDCEFWQGWRNHGRYWNGDNMPIGISSLASHAGNVMLNLNSELNPSGSSRTGIANAGGNCSWVYGCEGIHYTVIFTSGNERLLRLDAETVLGGVGK